MIIHGNHKSNKHIKPFIVELVKACIEFLNKYTPLEILFCNKLPNKTLIIILNKIFGYRDPAEYEECEKEEKQQYLQYLVEVWVIINIFISIIFLHYYNSNLTNYFSIFYIILLFYSAWRVFGILVSVNNIFLERLKKEFLKKGNKLRTFLLSIFNIFEIILWFALFYMVFNKHLFYCTFMVCPDSFINSIYFSIATMAGLTYNEIIPKYSNIILIPFILQMLLGIFFVIIVISSFISVISTSNNQK